MNKDQLSPVNADDVEVVPETKRNASAMTPLARKEMIRSPVCLQPGKGPASSTHYLVFATIFGFGFPEC
jgi:hypothetical protein